MNLFQISFKQPKATQQFPSCSLFANGNLEMFSKCEKHEHLAKDFPKACVIVLTDFKKNILCILCVCRSPWGSEEGIGSPEIRVTSSCKATVCGCWEPNLNLLQKQSVLLTVEPTLQPSLTGISSLLAFFFLLLQDALPTTRVP